jgi:hypothetical protein
MMSVNHKRLNPSKGNVLDAPLTREEVRHALRKGRGDTAPGRDGIGLPFFTEVWESLTGDLMELFNQMFSAGTVTTQQIGVIICIPKTASPKYPHEYRPITLLNNDYKTLAQLMGGRMTEV